MTRAEALEALRQQGAGIEAGLDGLRLSLPGPRLSRLEDVLALLPVVSVCALPILGMGAARMDYTGVDVSAMMALLGVFWVGVMVLLLTLPAAARSRRRADLLITDRSLRCREQIVPLESLRAVYVEKQRALLLVEGQEAPVLAVASDTDTLRALQALLTALASERRESLRLAGHDLTRSGAPPAALQALRGQRA